jgi:Zn finger protein HypA/HybF involved in hydrogenase expression
MGTEKDKAMEAYCMKCKQKREMKDPTQTTMKNGKPAMSGTCPVCGTKMFKIGATGAGAATDTK